MQDQQLTGIDLPLKALVWEDAEHKAWLSYNDPTWIAQRHSLGARSSPAVTVMADLLRRIAHGSHGHLALQLAKATLASVLRPRHTLQ